ncbi:MFS transporter [Paraburkholderia adhaesiva]|uniref:MFS transporter n=1 Tax=Paraburkholderia adhaesiva TaxID=2883244 RepID=UPI001F15851D|nr:MFS transporter [Paraburkholderia adhaesiva]
MIVADNSARLSGAAVATLALASGVAIANGYALQPSLSDIARDFGVSASRMTTLASMTMLGYLAGLALLVPLVDRFSPRGLIPAQMGALALLLVCASVAAGPVALDIGFFLVGAATTVAAQCSAVVGKYADPQTRARGMGTVSAGISAGILLSRFVGGLVSHWCGWRGALLVLAGFVALAAIAVRAFLPGGGAGIHRGYSTTVGAIPSLLREYVQLRRRTCTGMLWFFAFNLVWVGLAIRLAQPPYGMNAAAIGSYSLAGVLGLAVTRIAGRLTDRYGGRAVICCGLAVSAISALVLGVSLGRPIWLVVALATFDAGCFAAQVANQASVVAIQPARAGALNAAYLTLYYAAGACGAVVAGILVEVAEWGVMMVVAAIAITAAALVSMTSAMINVSVDSTRTG